MSGDGEIRVVRRGFLVGLGLAAGSLALGLFDDAAEARGKAPAPPPKPLPPQPGDGLRPNVFVHVAEDGLVSLVCHRSEMGQGVHSTLPTLMADELGADAAKVRMIQATGDKKYGDQNTDGSRSIRMDYAKLRKVAATARTMLIGAAAKRWHVPEAQCTARGGSVHHEATKRALGFGELAREAAKLPVPPLDQIQLRPDAEIRLHQALPYVSGSDVVTGRAQYGADVRLPGMLTAVIARPPVVGGRAVKHDASRALAIPGVVKVIALPVPKRPFGFQPLGGIAVVARDTWSALRGRAALTVEWDAGENAAYDSTRYREQLLANVRSPGKPARDVGDVDAAFAKAARQVEAFYTTPHLPHATMEPPAAVARIVDGKCEAWAPTQNPQAARAELGKALGIPEAEVTVNVTLLGGGFGRKSKPDFVVEAALLAREMDAPVRVQWTREDDIRHDYYHSTSAQRLAAALDDQGKVTAWHHRTTFPPIQSLFTDASASSAKGELQQGVIDLPLAVPNVRAENGEARAMTRIGWLRSVANVYHCFAQQSFLDEIAHARGKDPKANLLELIGTDRIVDLAELGLAELSNYGQPLTQHPIDTARLRGVIERAASLARWDARGAEGRALGIAAHRSFLTYVAVVVSVARRGERIVVDEAWVVADAGTVVNLERVHNQLEGALLMGLGQAMYGAITMKAGATEQGNFRDFRTLRIAEAPRRVHVEVVRSTRPPGGIGEPGVPPVAPALANAIFALTGTRVRDLPIVRTVPV